MDLTYRILLIYPLVNKQLAIENCHMTKFIDLPSYKMVDLSSSLCKRLPEGSGKSSRNGIIWWKYHGNHMWCILRETREKNPY